MMTKHARCDAHAPAANTPPQAQPKGMGTGHGPSLRSASRPGFPHPIPYPARTPFWPCREAQRAGRACAV